MLSAELGLPIGLKCGLTIASWEKTVALIEEPSIKATAQAAVAAGITAGGSIGGGFTPVDGCTGISTQISWRSNLYADVFGWKQYGFFDTGYKTLDKSCIA